VNRRARSLWARTRLHVWPEAYRLVSLAPEQLAEAARLVGSCSRGFAALVLERDEVSLTLPAPAWETSALKAAARAESGPWRAISFDLDIDLDVAGYLAPAAERLAKAGVSIVPQCAYLKDHLLVHEPDLAQAVAQLEALVAECAASGRQYKKR
jgi:hypothetical protein